MCFSISLLLIHYLCMRSLTSTLCFFCFSTHNALPLCLLVYVNDSACPMLQSHWPKSIMAAHTNKLQTTPETISKKRAREPADDIILVLEKIVLSYALQFLLFIYVNVFWFDVDLFKVVNWPISACGDGTHMHPCFYKTNE